MKFPSKVTPYKESILAKLPIILKLLQERDIRVAELYHKIKSRMSPIEFIEAVDCLFMLGKVDFIPGTEALHYVERNSL